MIASFNYKHRVKAIQRGIQRIESRTSMSLFCWPKACFRLSIYWCRAFLYVRQVLCESHCNREFVRMFVLGAPTVSDYPRQQSLECVKHQNFPCIQLITITPTARNCAVSTILHVVCQHIRPQAFTHSQQNASIRINVYFWNLSRIELGKN